MALSFPRTEGAEAGGGKAARVRRIFEPAISFLAGQGHPAFKGFPHVVGRLVPVVSEMALRGGEGGMGGLHGDALLFM